MNIITLERISELLNAFKSVRMMILGDLMVDKYIWGSGLRLSTEAPVPVIKVVHEEYSLGGAANIAFQAANLGAHTHLCGLVGYDDAAHQLRTRVAEAGINAVGIFPSANRPTTQKVRIMSLEHAQLLNRFDYETSASLYQEEEATLKRFINSYIDDIDIIVISDQGNGTFSSKSFNTYLKTISQEKGIKMYAQSRTENIEKFAWTRCLMTNTKIAQKYLQLRHINLPFNTKHLGIKLKTLISCDHLILYNDVDQTITFFGPNDFIFSYGNSPLQLVDQTGQGDIITALVSLSLSVGASPKESVILSYRGWRLANQQLGTGKINKKKLIE